MNKVQIGQMLYNHGLDMDDFMEWFKNEGETRDNANGTTDIPYYEVERFIRINVDEEVCIDDKS